MHLRIALAFLVLGRRGRTDDRGVDEGPGRPLHAARLQVLVHATEDLFAQLVLRQQMPKLADRRFVRCSLNPQINADKLPPRLRIALSPSLFPIPDFYRNRPASIREFLELFEHFNSFLKGRPSEFFEIFCGGIVLF